MKTYNPIKDCYWLAMTIKLYGKSHSAAERKRIERATWLAFLAERERMNNHYLRIV